MLLTAAEISYESAASQQVFAAATDSSDHLKFTLASKPWSRAPGYEPVIAPYGLLTGGVITPAAVVANNTIDVSALTAMMPAATGASATTGELSVAAGTSVTVARGASAYIINSITVNASGALAVVAGTAGTGPFVETRGATNGPPFIPVGSIEIGQVRYTSATAAAVASSEIFQVLGLHQERSDYPVYNADYIAGTITFASALPLIHTGSVAKAVYARVATPVFAPLSRAKDWVPAEESNSASSVQYYDGTVGSFSSSLGQASFTIGLGDGHTDALLAKKGQNLLFRFKSDKNKSPYQITQGVIGVSRTYAVGTSPAATVTVTADQASADFPS